MAIIRISSGADDVRICPNDFTSHPPCTNSKPPAASPFGAITDQPTSPSPRTTAGAIILSPAQHERHKGDASDDAHLNHTKRPSYAGTDPDPDERVPSKANKRHPGRARRGRQGGSMMI
ncbi:hypothetical protein BDZ97DRAFT_1924864 [Flammula alnicola]|nr:hypothetical protein BDZ97DRAFT_1924864 [Flammula alnicola]